MQDAPGLLFLLIFISQDPLVVDAFEGAVAGAVVDPLVDIPAPHIVFVEGENERVADVIGQGVDHLVVGVEDGEGAGPFGAGEVGIIVDRVLRVLPEELIEVVDGPGMAVGQEGEELLGDLLPFEVGDVEGVQPGLLTTPASTCVDKERFFVTGKEYENQVIMG